jgi:peptidoglycan hydrolase-like protein with peptidoglycan-binding domain
VDKFQYNLSLHDHGDYVALLQDDLRRLGADIDGDEIDTQMFGRTTEQAVRAFQQQQHLDPTGAVDERTAAQIRRQVDDLDVTGRNFLVYGRVIGDGGDGIVVQAVDRDLRSEEALGELRITNGRYAIRYNADQFARAEKGHADLVVIARNAAGRELRRSDVVFNARAVQRIDLTLALEARRGVSEFEQLVRELSPLLEGFAFADLVEDERHQDLSFLASETGRDSKRIAFLIAAHKLTRRTEIIPEVFFALFREGLPVRLRELLTQGREVLERSLVDAAAVQIVPAQIGANARAHVDELTRLGVRLFMEQPVADGRASPTDLLAGALSTPDLRQTFIDSYVHHDGTLPAFWQALRARPEYAGRIEELQTTLHIAALTRNHLPLFRELNRMRQAGELASLRDLVRYDESGWTDLLSRDGPNGRIGAPADAPGATEPERIATYAKALANTVEDAFPTAYFARRLEQDDGFPGRDDWRAFLGHNQEFDLRKDRLDLYLQTHPGALTGLADTARTRAHIKTTQRLFKLTPRYRQVRALLGADITSAYATTRIGWNVFHQLVGLEFGTTYETKAFYSKAQQSSSMALNLLAAHGLPGIKLPTKAVPDTAVLDVEGVPEWAAMFGSLELCSCDHCRSVLSPAAYLVDLLQFLSDRPSRVVGKKAKDVLFLRRPDLGEIELTCENTNTPLPYVDLVLEILEDAVAPPPPFAPFSFPAADTAAIETALNNRAINDLLENAFTPPLSQDAVITVGNEGQPWGADDEPWWSIDEPSCTYSVRKTAGQIRVEARSRQTKGAAAERAATPQYRNAAAYQVLSETVYPWSLPFDLAAREAAVYFDHVGVRRDALMETLMPGSREEILQNVGLGRESLGLTSFEASIIVGSTAGQPGSATPGPWNLWGFTAATLTPDTAIPDPSDSLRRIAAGGWLDVIRGRVDVFLQQAGLTYRDLLELLGTYYVNPVAGEQRLITIVSTDPDNIDTCDTSKLALHGLDDAAAARAVRFVRLWRRLGWNMRDLDRAVTALGGSAFNDAFVTNVAHVNRLATSPSVPIPRTLSWWSPIDSAFYVDHSAPGSPRAASLYDQLFRNRSVINPPDPAFVERPEDLSGALSDHVATIAAALKLPVTDFRLLLASTDVLPPEAADPTVPSDVLSLDTLSRLHRHASLARAARLKIRDYLSALTIVMPNPFATTTSTILFLERVNAVAESGFTFTELAYVLRHVDAPDRPLAPADIPLGILLTGLRDGIQQIALENTFRSDPSDPAGPTVDLDGGLTRQKLALLNWDRSLVDLVVATMSDAMVYEQPLAALPSGMTLPNAPPTYVVPLAALPGQFTFPEQLGGALVYDSPTQQLRALRLLTGPERALLVDSVNAAGDAALSAAVAALLAQQDATYGEVTFDADRGVLRFRGVMTNARKARLDSVPGADNPYLAAIQVLYDAPRRFVRRHMRAFAIPDFSVALAALPVKIPPALKARVYFDDSSGQPRLHSRGALTDEERNTLVALATNAADPQQAAFVSAVQELVALPDSFTPKSADEFLTTDGANADTTQLFDARLDIGDRFALVLAKLLPHLRTVLAERLVVQTFADDQNLESRAADLLMRRLIVSLATPTVSCLQVLLDPHYTESDPQVAVTVTAFSAQFLAYLRMYKASLLVRRFKLSFVQLGWLFAYGEASGWLDLSTLPLASDQSPATFEGWTRLAELAQLRNGLPRGEETLELLLKTVHGVAADATPQQLDVAKAQWFEVLRQRTRWLDEDLAALLGSANDHSQTGPLAATFPEDYRGVRLLFRLWEVFATLKRAGLSAGTAVALSAGDPSPSTVRLFRQAIHGKYLDDAQWQTVIKPLADALREQQRAALVAYLVAHLRLPLTILEWPHPTLTFNANQLVTRPAVRELQRKLNAAGATPAVAVNTVFDNPTRVAVVAFQQQNGLAGNGTVNAETWALLDAVRHGVHDSNDLYGQYLIDVEMDPCMLTSRIKQALGSIQLYVQRSLMGLEPDVAAGIDIDTHWRQWKWMKNYRVWEANRKIFLYPENWIEPELRDDKSPFFRELESELLQADLSDERAEDALLHYLMKLDQVARLEIVGLHHQVEKDATGNGAVDVLHVFGRTTGGTPRAYFYRRRSDGFWTAWERVDLDITGDHLLPLIWNRRLHLFWPIFSEEMADSPNNVQFTGSELTGLDVEKFRELRIAWSEYRQNSWTPKKTSASAFKVLTSKISKPEDAFFRWSIDEHDNLSIGFRKRPEEDALDSVMLVVDVLTDPDVKWVDVFDMPGVADVEPPPPPKLNLGLELMLGFRFDGCHAEPVRAAVIVNPVVDLRATTFDRMYFKEQGNTKLYLPAPADSPALAATPGTFRILPHSNEAPIAKHGTFYQDDTRAYFVEPHRVRVRPKLDDLESADPSVLVLNGPFVYPELEKIDPAGPVINPADPMLFEASFPAAVDAALP